MKKIWKKVVAVSMAAVLMCGCGTGSGAQTGSQEEQGAVQGSQAEENAGGNSSDEAAMQYPEYLNLDSFRPIVKEGEEVTLRVLTMRESIANNDVKENWFVKFIEE